MSNNLINFVHMFIALDGGKQLQRVFFILRGPVLIGALVITTFISTTFFALVTLVQS